MTPDDWRKGMENEAASVEDLEWAGRTRRAAQRFQRRSALSAAVIFALMGAAQVLLLHISWPHQQPVQLWLGVMGTVAVATAALTLGRRGLAPLAAGVGALAYLPGAWLAVLLLQGLLGDAAPHSPGFIDGDVALLAVTAASAAGLMTRLMSRRPLA